MHVLSGAEVPILKIMFPSAAFRQAPSLREQ